MFNKLIERRIEGFERDFGYDAGYAREILRAGRRAFFRFARLEALAAYREEVPPQAWYAAKLVATMHEDCGPCTQLVADMALRAGVAPEVIRAVVDGNEEGMGPVALLGCRFARAVLAHQAAADDLRAEVLRRWGQRALVSLAFGITVSRMYPTIKYALGHGRACTVVRVGDALWPVKAGRAA